MLKRALIAIPLLAILLIATYAHSTGATVTFTQIKAEFKPSDTQILDRHGELLQRIRTDATVRRGQWIALADVSPALRTALVLSEDQRFYEHSGVDWRAASAAAWSNLWNSKTRGASTLTMQLAGLLDEDLQRGRDGKAGRSVVQKVGQAVSAQMLERSWRKDQILEAYLNLVPLRGELVGIDAISRTLFGKAAHGLDEREAAITAALVRAPNARAGVVARRACEVLGQMQGQVLGQVQKRAGRPQEARGKPVAVVKPDCEALDLITTAALQRKSFDASEGIAPHFARRLLTLHAPSPHPSPAGRGRNTAQLNSLSFSDGRGSNATERLPLPSPAGQGSKATELLPQPIAAGPQSNTTELLPLPPAGEGRGELVHQSNVLQTTLRAPLQRFAVQTLQQHLRELRGRHVEDGAVLVLDNASGEVLAWVGSSGELSAAAEVDGVTALRQPGSTLKPFLYAQAIAERRITAASLLEDAATHIPTAGGLYIPQNYDHHFKGWVSARTALGASLNVPAVRALVMVSPDAFHKQLKAVGLPLKESGDFHGYSLALGSAEVSLLSLSNSYRTLSNGGGYSPIYFLPHTRTDSRTEVRSLSALDPRAAFIVTDILADPLARARTFGTDSVLATRFWTAVKTGTSKDMRDNWAVGFSQRYTVGVWVGNASGEPMRDVSGTSGAAPVWAAVMNHLHKTEPSRAPQPPAGLVQTQVTFGASPDDSRSLEAPRSEWFLQGTEQNQITINSVATYALSTRARGQSDSKFGTETHPRITAPTSGTIIALDPDIPPNRQRVSFTAEGGNLRWRTGDSPPRWLMDGKPFAKGSSAQWLPWPGRHVVQLTDARGAVLDEIRLEVRGAGVKASQASFARGR